MSHYLRKYVGKYRVKAEYDSALNDYPRLDDGRIDPSFDDLYIECRNQIKIKHCSGSTLCCYIPNKTKGINILKKIYKDKIQGSCPAGGKYYDSLVKRLIKNDVILRADVLDFEVLFEFNASDIDYFADIVGARVSGANISPFSSKNLPKSKYTIPESDISIYKNAITKLYTGGDKKEFNMSKLNSLNKEFEKVIINSQAKGFDLNKDKKIKGLKTKEYIHSFGSDMWTKYCNFLHNAISEK